MYEWSTCMRAIAQGTRHKLSMETSHVTQVLGDHLQTSKVRHNCVKHLPEISQTDQVARTQAWDCGSTDALQPQCIRPPRIKPQKCCGSWRQRLTNDLIFRDVIPLSLLQRKELSSRALQTVYSLYPALHLYFGIHPS